MNTTDRRCRTIDLVFVNENKMLFAEGNAIKYICRHARKGGKEDLLKAKHYQAFHDR